MRWGTWLGVSMIIDRARLCVEMKLEKPTRVVDAICPFKVIWTAAASVFAASPKNRPWIGPRHDGAQSLNALESFKSPKTKALCSDAPTPM